MQVTKTKGPAEGATSPDHGSQHPLEGKPMNMVEDSAGAPGGQGSSRPIGWVDKLDDVLAELDTILFALQHPQVQDDIVEPVRMTMFGTIRRLRSVRDAIEGRAA